jgi:hypothetical protein
VAVGHEGGQRKAMHGGIPGTMGKVIVRAAFEKIQIIQYQALKYI